jgi:hypothetical protein
MIRAPGARTVPPFHAAALRKIKYLLKDFCSLTTGIKGASAAGAMLTKYDGISPASGIFCATAKTFSRCQINCRYDPFKFRMTVC